MSDNKKPRGENIDAVIYNAPESLIKDISTLIDEAKNQTPSSCLSGR